MRERRRGDADVSRRMVPSNMVQAAADRNMLGVTVATMGLGVALANGAPEHAQAAAAAVAVMDGATTQMVRAHYVRCCCYGCCCVHPAINLVWCFCELAPPCYSSLGSRAERRRARRMRARAPSRPASAPVEWVQWQCHSGPKSGQSDRFRQEVNSYAVRLQQMASSSWNANKTPAEAHEGEERRHFLEVFFLAILPLDARACRRSLAAANSSSDGSATAPPLPKPFPLPLPLGAVSASAYLA
jgi:hypothetical protein